MDRPSGSSGFDRSEMIPPVPAPRYKRKLITNEDSKYSSNKQNTCMSEQTTEVLPPPRRKHKSHLVNKTNALTYPNNIKNKIRESSLEKNSSTIKEIQIISNGEQSPTSSNKSDMEIGKHDLNRDIYLNLDEQKCSKTSEMTDAFSEIVDSSILKNFINNRVLDIPLGNTEKSSFICTEQTSTQDSDVDEGEKNRVNSSLTENSATIVGVFYKPEYSLLKLVNGNNVANLNVNTELDSIVWSSSFVNDGKMKKVVLPNESVGINIHLNKKDSEEDDSGVYFSDTKSPPHRANDSEITNENVNDEIDTSSDFQFFEPFTSNDRDTFDNNSSELGPNMYIEVLDSFEAQTVSALREEVTGRLSLCSELSKNKAVENWLDNGDYPSMKKVINSNLSEYLKNMLEVEESERSLSPYPLSTVDESSDVSEKGANDETEFVGQSYTLEARTVPSNLSETRENRNVVSSDKYFSSFVDTNSVNNVNNECTEVTQCKIKSISLLGNPQGNVKDVETFSYVGQLRMSSENNTSQGKLFFKETSRPESVSPSIEHGAVNQLITFFETIHTEKGLEQEHESEYEDDINEATQDVDKSQDETKSKDHYAENMMAIGHKEQCRSSVIEVNIDQEETLGHQYLEEENSNVENTIRAKGTHESELETFTKLNNLEPDRNKTNHKINLINYSCLQPVELVEREFSSPIELKIVNFENASTTISTELKNEQNIKCQRNTCIKMCDDGISRVDQDIEELRPPMEFADDKELPVLLDINEMTEINSKVPNFNISTKDLLKSDDTCCPYKPTRIPIVILTEADVKSVPIGSVELHPLESFSKVEDSKGMTVEMSLTKVTDSAAGVVNNCQEEECYLENAVTVMLEKNWGSIGLKIKGDANGVVISDILVGGAADQSGLVFQGLLSTEKKPGTDF